MLDEKVLSEDQVLQEYKAQQSTERGFRFLKEPLFFTSSVFLKTPQRVAALAMLMGLCLLVYSWGQRSLRQALERAKQTIENQVGKPTAQPTLRWVFQCFMSIHLLTVNGVKQITNLTRERLWISNSLVRLVANITCSLELLLLRVMVVDHSTHFLDSQIPYFEKYWMRRSDLRNAGLNIIQYRFWSVVTATDIPLNCQIQGGLLLPHPNGIVIHPSASIGPNCLILQQVTIVADVKIGGHVDIGAGAKIIRSVTIGDHALIGANAVVICDVPPGATAVGIPAKIIEKKTQEV